VTVSSRHAQIGEHNIVLLFGEHGHRLFAIGRLVAGKPVTIESAHGEPTNVGFVVDDQRTIFGLLHDDCPQRHFEQK
jgi:hypothetical protein